MKTTTTKFLVIQKSFKPALIMYLLIIPVNLLFAQETIDVGKTRWDVKRAVMAAVCESGCPLGELLKQIASQNIDAEFVEVHQGIYL